MVVLRVKLLVIVMMFLTLLSITLTAIFSTLIFYYSSVHEKYKGIKSDFIAVSYEAIKDLIILIIVSILFIFLVGIICILIECLIGVYSIRKK